MKSSGISYKFPSKKLNLSKYSIPYLDKKLEYLNKVERKTEEETKKNNDFNEIF